MTESLSGLHTVILLDQHERWQRGDRAHVETYLRLVPELGTDGQRLLDLIYQEVLLREAAGESPAVEEYVRRFPELAEELRVQFEVHAGLPPAALPDLAATKRPFPQIDGFRIERELGRGTYGVVYEAWEEKLSRPVAIKLIPRESNTESAAPELTFREAQSIAQLTHPNIVPIHAVGETEEGFFFSQDLVSGGTLAAFCRSVPQPPRQAADFIATIADAVHYAHLRRVIHCDLKPANILLRPRSTTLAGSKPRSLADFDPLVSDFGLALHQDAENCVCGGHLRGTLHYMSPEQTGLPGVAIGPATDVYALGAILYELLTGHAPFANESKLNVFLKVRHSPPTEPRQLRSEVPSDLNAVCVKCLAKDPALRYASAAELADDLRRFLAGYAPLAVAAGPIDRFARWFRRNPVVAALVVALVVTVSGSLAAITEKIIQTERAQQKERQRIEELDAALYRNQFRLAWNAWNAADVGRAIKVLEQTKPERRSLEWHYLHGLCLGSRELIPWDGHDVSSAVPSPDGATIAIADAVETITLVERSSGEKLHALARHEVRLTPPVFHPQGKLVAAAGSDKGECWIWLWDSTSGRESRRIGPLQGTPLSIVFTSDGNNLVSASYDGRTLLTIGEKPLVMETWETDSGRKIRTQKGPATDQAFTPKGELSPEGRWLAWTPSLPTPPRSSYRHEVQLVDVSTGKAVPTVLKLTDRVLEMAFSPDGRTLATFTDDGGCLLWNTATGKLNHKLKGHSDAVLSADFSSDGQTLATGGRDQAIMLWNVSTGERKRILRGHQSIVRSVRFVTDELLLSADVGKQVSLWKTSAAESLRYLHAPAVGRMAFGGEGTQLLLSDISGALQTVDLAKSPPQAASKLSLETLDFAFHPASSLVAAVGPDGKLRLGTLGENSAWVEVQDLPRISANGSSPIVITPDGNTVACLEAEGKAVHLIDVSSRKVTANLTPNDKVRAIACRGDGRLFATASEEGPLELWDLAQRRVVRTVTAPFPLRAVAFRPGGNDLAAIALQDRLVQIWNSDTGEERLRIEGHKLQVTCLAYSPDGLRLVTGSADRTVKVWDSESGEELLSLDPFQDQIQRLALSADGRRLAICAGSKLENSEIVVLGGGGLGDAKP